MKVYEHAMQMELDGKKYYEECAEKVEFPYLKQVLMELASDEVKHYEIFKAMRDNIDPEFEESAQTKIFTSIKNVFQILKDENKEFSFAEDSIDIWTHALEVEKKAEEFYRQAASNISDPKQAAILLRIADEEHRHWISIDNVINFLNRPSQWLENAEWHHADSEQY